MCTCGKNSDSKYSSKIKDRILEKTESNGDSIAKRQKILHS